MKTFMHRCHMKKTIFAFLIAVPAFAAEQDPLQGITFKDSPFETCQNITFVGKDDYSKNKEFWDKAINECGADVQVLPDTGFFNTIKFKLGEQDENRRSNLFLRRVGARAKAYVDLNNGLTERLVQCARKNKKWFEEKAAAARSIEEEESYDFAKCGSLLDSLKDVISEVRPQLRQAIALGRYQDLMQAHELDANVNPEKYINTRMQAAPGLVIPRGHEKLERDEIEAAVKRFNEDTKEIEASFDKRLAQMREREAELKKQGMSDWEVRQRMPKWFYEYNPAKKWNNVTFQDHVKRERQTKFAQHRDQYMQLLTKAPILAFIGKKNPSDEEIAVAAEQLLKNGKEEKEKIEKVLASVDKPIEIRGTKTPKTDQNQAKEMFEFMKYGPIVREILAEDPSQCKTATGIANYISNSELRNNVALMAGMVGGIGYLAVRGTALAAGTALAGLSNTALSTLAALPVAGGFYYRDYKNFVDAERRFFNVPETERVGVAISDLKDYEEAKNALSMSLAIAGTGIDFWGLGLGKGLAMVGGAALAGKLGTKAASSAGLRNALKSKGLSNAEIAKVFADLNSGNEQVAGRAAAKLIKDLNLDDAEIRFMRMAAKKGVLKEQNASALLDPIRKELHQLPSGPERKRIWTKAMEILDGVNSAKLNEYNRRQVLESAIAGARFGIKDPKQLAAKINDWEEGLEGLTKTFQIAQKRLDDPAIRKIANLEERQKAAFDKALDEMRAMNPQLKAMPDSEWAKIKPGLANCGLGGKS